MSAPSTMFDSVSNKAENFFKRENYTNKNGEPIRSSYTPAGAATIGGLIGASLGGIGGYMFAPINEDTLSEDEKFKKRLKSALLGAGIGGIGGAGLGYGINTFVDAQRHQREKGWMESATDYIVDEVPLWGSAGIGAGSAGAITGLMEPKKYDVAYDKKGVMQYEVLTDSKGNPIDPKQVDLKHSKVPHYKTGDRIYVPKNRQINKLVTLKRAGKWGAAGAAVGGILQVAMDKFRGTNS